MGAFGELLKARWGDPTSSNNTIQCDTSKRKINYCNKCKKQTIKRDLADFGMNPKWYCLDNGTGIHPI